MHFNFTKKNSDDNDKEYEEPVPRGVKITDKTDKDFADELAAEEADKVRWSQVRHKFRSSLASGYCLRSAFNIHYNQFYHLPGFFSSRRAMHNNQKDFMEKNYPALVEHMDKETARRNK